MVRKKVEINKKQGFYSKVLDEAEKIRLEEAWNIEGLDEEIAMLRVRLRTFIEENPDRIDLHIKMVVVIARLVGVRYNINKKQKNSLREAITKVITDIAVPLGVKMIIK
jgi:hypothetical protein